MMQRRQFLTVLGALGLVPTAGMLVGCQQKTNMTVVVPFPPGGGGDVLARIILQPLSESTERSVVIMNRAGAGGNVGTRFVSRITQGEGQYLYVTNGTLCVNKHLYGSGEPGASGAKADAAGGFFDPVKDLKFVASFSRIPLVMALNVNALEGVTDFDTLIGYAKAHPGALACASAGVGTTSHIASAIFSKLAGVEINHIPHAGGAAAAKEVLSGRIPFFIDVAPNVLPLVRDGRLKPLAVTSRTRSTLLPEVPTLIELGLKDFDLTAWDGLAASRNVSDAEIAGVHKAVNAILEQKAVAERLSRLGAEPSMMTREGFEQFIEKENPRWESFVKTFVRPLMDSNKS